MNKIKKVLVAGGAGYIGTHCCVELIQNGYEVICADNFDNSSPEAIHRVEMITGTKIVAHDVDFCDQAQVQKLFINDFDAAIHFAGHKAVDDSICNPIKYYRNNVLSLLNLCEALQQTGRKKIVFSSSAVVYDEKAPIPYDESSPRASSNPYGRTKIIAEDILKDLHRSDPEWSVSTLRYFNPVGAHPSGLIGETPNGVPSNLMPYISQVAIGKLEKLSIYGDNYDTPDGTCIRDFIHIVDLARAHLAALKRLEKGPGHLVHNIGTGMGHSVKELVRTFERINNVKVPHKIVDRRPGDMPVSYAATGKAEKELNWRATHDLKAMVRDTWNWQQKNPRGYSS